MLMGDQFPHRRVEYNKLVRDAIPEIIRSKGERCEVIVMSEAEYRQALRTKLMEEAREVAEASEESLVTELADLQEVMQALMKQYNLSPETVHAEQARRRKQR